MCIVYCVCRKGETFRLHVRMRACLCVQGGQKVTTDIVQSDIKVSNPIATVFEPRQSRLGVSKGKGGRNFWPTLYYYEYALGNGESNNI